MAKEIENLKSVSDKWKTYVAIAVVIATLYLYYSNPLAFNTLTNVIVTLVLFGIAGVIFIKSAQGERFLHFLKETRI